MRRRWSTRGESSAPNQSDSCLQQKQHNDCAGEIPETHYEQLAQEIIVAVKSVKSQLMTCCADDGEQKRDLDQTDRLDIGQFAV